MGCLRLFPSSSSATIHRVYDGETYNCIYAMWACVRLESGSRRRWKFIQMQEQNEFYFNWICGLIVPLIDLSDILDVNIERFLVTVARAITVNRCTQHADQTIPTCTIIIVCFIAQSSDWQPTAHYVEDTLLLRSNDLSKQPLFSQFHNELTTFGTSQHLSRTRTHKTEHVRPNKKKNTQMESNHMNLVLALWTTLDY